MARNVYFSHGIKNEQFLIEDIIVESLSIYGQDFYYIPRKLVAKDQILGEDRLSEFKTAYPIEMYMENVEGFEGQGAFIQKFGLMMEQTATLVVARRRWDQLIGRFKQTQLPNRPCEGDLIYYPLSKGLFEIKFVQHQDPFYQLGKLYVYKLQVELFQYASERIDTGIDEIDVFETLKSHDTDYARDITGSVTSVTLTKTGSGYTYAPTLYLTGGAGTFQFKAAEIISYITSGSISKLKITNVGVGYDAAPIIQIGETWNAGSSAVINKQVAYGENLYTITTGGAFGNTSPTHTSGAVQNGTATLTYAGKRATATASIEVNPDLPQSYGDNIKFRGEASDLIFDTSNPFGEVIQAIPAGTPGYESISLTFYADSNSLTVDSSLITTDNN